jgi:hypothetical protein
MLFNNGAAAIENTTVAVAITTTRLGLTTSEACQLVVTLVRQLAAARGERDVYRQMVSVALAQLHERDIELAQERDSRFRLLADYRALRGGPCH